MSQNINNNNFKYIYAETGTIPILKHVDMRFKTKLNFMHTTSKNKFFTSVFSDIQKFIAYITSKVQRIIK